MAEMNESEVTLEVSRVQWIAGVGLELGYPGRMPFEVYRSIESYWLMKKSKEEAIKELSHLRGMPV